MNRAERAKARQYRAYTLERIAEQAERRRVNQSEQARINAVKAYVRNRPGNGNRLDKGGEGCP